MACGYEVSSAGLRAAGSGGWESPVVDGVEPSPPEVVYVDTDLGELRSVEWEDPRTPHREVLRTLEAEL